METFIDSALKILISVGISTIFIVLLCEILYKE